MKKITLLVFMLILAVGMVSAGGDWGTSAVSLTKDGSSSYLYVLNNQGWTDGTWGSNTAFDSFDFGTPTTLVLNGGAGNAWTSDSPGYDATSFKIYYRVYESTAIPGNWSSMDLINPSYHNGNNFIFDKSDASIDILAFAVLPGLNTYTLEVVMSKNQYYTGGNWNSMVPGGQTVAYNASTSGYKATFTKMNAATNINSLNEFPVKIYSQEGNIDARFTGDAQVKLYTVTGQLIRSTFVSNQFIQPVKSGAYLLQINGKTYRVIAQ
ncbi:MAG: hypothetical protein P4L34_00505 [Paludibacter sp.]|nr:hypothetical protein [Paludibacter sp.]